MQKKNKKQTKPIKQILLYTAITMLLLLIVFAEDIMKLANKNKIGLLENTPNETMLAEPNVPVISAGMIPVKWDGTNWIITTKEDWYDYKNGKLAYVMLNDGYYRSEIERGVEQDQLMENNVGTVITNTEDLGTIFAWIPRFAYNEEGEIQYIKDVESADENWTIPDMFTHKQELETAPDFLLTGIWLEKDVDNAYTSKINQMNQEESIYGFIKNTIAIKTDQPTQNTIQNYIENIVGSDASVRPQIANITNPNRIILKIINQKNQDWVKAKASHNKETGLITVQITYSQYGISKIMLEQTNELSFSKTNKVITADTAGIDLEDGENTITIIDSKGNRKDLKVQVISKIYAEYYSSDGTLAFGKSQNPLGKSGATLYGDISGKEYTSTSTIPWYSNRERIKSVEFADKISPTSTAYWLYGCKNLTTINNISNLNTRNVTNMSYMFAFCSSITELDVSNFDTRNVTDMASMFNNCSSITELDVSNFNTSKVTNMQYMFRNCSRITELDLSNFNTSKVTDMQYMFYYCTSLIQLDLSNFDTSNVTGMQYMFFYCTSLRELDLSNFNTSKVTNMEIMFLYCSSLKELDVSKFNTSKVTNMRSMFCECSSITELNVSNFNTSNVADMQYMFSGCSSITELNVSNFDTSNVTNMQHMFQNCSRIEKLNLNNFNTSNVTDMQHMFHNCSSITELNLSKFDTSNVIKMTSMFCNCSSLIELDVSSFNTSNVTDMSYMFDYCSDLTELNVSNFDTSNVTSMQEMFEGCDNLISLDISSFNVSKKPNMQYMFYNCSNLEIIYVNKLTTMWPNISNSTSSSSKYYYIFQNCGTNTTNKKVTITRKESMQ